MPNACTPGARQQGERWMIVTSLSPLTSSGRYHFLLQVQTPWLKEFRNWDGIPSVIWLQKPTLPEDPLYRTHTISTRMPNTGQHMRDGTPATAVQGREEAGHFYKETEAQISKADMEIPILSPKDRKLHGRSIFLALHMWPLDTPFTTSGSRKLSLFFSRLCPWGNLIHVHDLNTVMNTKPYSSSDFSSNYWPLFLISYWVFPCCAIPKILHLISLKSIQLSVPPRLLWFPHFRHHYLHSRVCLLPPSKSSQCHSTLHGVTTQVQAYHG